MTDAQLGITRGASSRRGERPLHRRYRPTRRLSWKPVPCRSFAHDRPLQLPPAAMANASIRNVQPHEVRMVRMDVNGSAIHHESASWPSRTTLRTSRDPPPAPRHPVAVAQSSVHSRPSTVLRSARGRPLAGEVLVIGGGANGTSIAFHLAEAGVRDIVLQTRPPARHCLREHCQLGCHSSTRSPSGSVTQPNRPTPSMS